MEGEHGEQQDREGRVQRPPDLVAANVEALSAGAGEVLVDLGAQRFDLPPALLQVGRELGHLRIDLFDRAGRVGVVGDKAAEVTRLPRRQLRDGDVDVERGLLDADQVVPGDACDRHEHAEDEQDLS